MDDNTKEEILHWVECYVFKIMTDPHQEFANRLRINRTEAKRKCYEIAYHVANSGVIKAYY